MKVFKILLTVIFCFSLQSTFAQAWLTTGNTDIDDQSFIGTKLGTDRDVILKRDGVTGLHIAKYYNNRFNGKLFVGVDLITYSYIPTLQVGGRVGDMANVTPLMAANIFGSMRVSEDLPVGRTLSAQNLILRERATMNSLAVEGAISAKDLTLTGRATIPYLNLETRTGEALFNINLANATRTWTGVTYKRQGSEKWFSGIIHGTDDFTIRRNAAHNDFVINSDGRVKIGTRPVAATSPYFNSYKLAVDGTIISTQTVVTQQNWADDEFVKESPLLKEEKEFAQKNNHLLGIPSQKEIIEKGLDLGEMQAMQIRKIEQLYKHMWEQQETIEKLKKEVEELKKK